MTKSVIQQIDDDWKMYNDFPAEVRDALSSLAEENLWWDGEATPQQYQHNFTHALKHWKKIQKKHGLEHIDYRSFA